MMDNINQIPDFGFYNMDCEEGMKLFPDNFFDCAIVDPPYGDKVGKGGVHAQHVQWWRGL